MVIEVLLLLCAPMIYVHLYSYYYSVFRICVFGENSTLVRVTLVKALNISEWTHNGFAEHIKREALNE